MTQTRNSVTVQGPAGPPVVRLSRDGPVFASVPVEIDDLPRTAITVAGIGLEAATIASLGPGETLRVEGFLRLDAESGAFYVFAAKAARMVARGDELVAVPTSVSDLSRLETVLAPTR